MTQSPIPEQFIGNPVILTAIEDLGFSVRTENRLKANNVFYIVDILSKGHKGILNIPEFTSKSYNEVIDKLGELGITYPVDHAGISDVLDVCEEGTGGDHKAYLNNVRKAFKLPQEEIAPRKKTPIIPVDGQIEINGDGAIQCEFKLSPILKVAIKEGIVNAEELNEIFGRHVQQANVEIINILKNGFTMGE